MRHFPDRTLGFFAFVMLPAFQIKSLCENASAASFSAFGFNLRSGSFLERRLVVGILIAACAFRLSDENRRLRLSFERDVADIKLDNFVDIVLAVFAPKANQRPNVRSIERKPIAALKVKIGAPISAFLYIDDFFLERPIGQVV